MTENERRLSIVFAGIVAFSVTFLSIADLSSYIGAGQARERAALKLLEEHGKELAAIDDYRSIASVVEKVNDPAPEPEAVDLIGFGDIVKDLCKQYGLVISRYTIVQVQTGRALDFSTVGDPDRFVAFLAAIERSRKGFGMTYLTSRMSRKDGTIQATFRIAQKEEL